MAKKKSSKLSALVGEAGPIAPRRPTKEDIAREKRWQAESDISTMQRAEEIKKDPARMSEMKKVAKEQVNTLKKIC